MFISHRYCSGQFDPAVKLEVKGCQKCQTNSFFTTVRHINKWTHNRGGSKHIKYSLHGSPTNITLCQADLYKMSSRSKWMTVQEARAFITDHDSEIEEDVSEDEDDLELNSDSNESDFEPDEGIAIPIPPSKTFMSKHGEIQWSSSPNMSQAKLSAENIIKTVPGPTRMAVTRVTDIKSAFELVMPNSIQKIILEMTNL